MAYILEPTNFVWIFLENSKTLGFSVKKFLTSFCATHVSINNSDPFSLSLDEPKTGYGAFHYH